MTAKEKNVAEQKNFHAPAIQYISVAISYAFACFLRAGAFCHFGENNMI